MLKFPIYLDYSATTPVDPRVAAKMIPYLTEKFGNPASRSHAYGWEAEAAVEEARAEVAALLNADAKDIIWTSGATESNNLAIKGAAHFYSGKGKHLVTVTTEHKAVLDTMRELERQGFSVTYLEPQENGLITLDQFKAALRPDSILASVMAVNNEIGVIQPIAELAAIGRAIDTKRIVPEASSGVRHAPARRPAYDFQRLVAGLLRAMGYHIAWIAPPARMVGPTSSRSPTRSARSRRASRCR